MYIDLLKQNRRKTSSKLIKEFRQINKELKEAQSVFNFVTEPDFIQAAIFRLNELEAKRKGIIIKIKTGEY